MKTGKYELRAYPYDLDWPRNKLPGFLGPQIPENAKTVSISLELYIEDTAVKGVMTTQSGKQRTGPVTCSDFSAAWEAYAGQCGDGLLKFAIIASDSEDAVWGFAVGRDAFRGYMALEGKYMGLRQDIEEPLGQPD